MVSLLREGVSSINSTFYTVPTGHGNLREGKNKLLTSYSVVAEDFHSSGAARLCPPDNSAHISAHNSVAVAVGVREQARREAIMNYEYERARKRAQKKGRDIGSPKEYHNHWG